MQTGSGWPIVGRDDELRQALAALEGDAEFHGVALVGDSGVGKSTLARALADTLESGGSTVRYVLGTQTGSTVPLGAFYRSVTVDAPQEPAAMLAAAQRTLEREQNLVVVVVDDAQLLDRFRHLAANKRLRPPMRSALGPAPPSPKPAPWSRESAGRSPVVPRAGAAPRPIYPCGSALRCRRTAARPCCSSSWMCWSQPHSPSLVW